MYGMGANVKSFSFTYSYWRKNFNQFNEKPSYAKIIKTIDELEKYKWSGHGAILEKNKNDWQEINEILNRFGKTTGIAKRGYHKFIREGLQMEKRCNIDVQMTL